MYCTQCGSEIPDDAKFCPFCAELVVRSTSPQIQPTQPAQPAQPPFQQPFQPTPITKPKSSGAAGGVIAAICTVFIVGIVLLYFGATTLAYIPGTGITLLVIGSIIILCIGCSICSVGSRRRGYSGGGDCSGCDCSGCDCDCGGCDC